MLLRTSYDDKLAQAAYLIGCQRTGEAIVIDPQRDVDRYIAAAGKEGVRIVAVAETHIHADFISGARELAERVGAHVYVSGEGGPEWQYQWLDRKSGGGAYPHERLRHGVTFHVGQIEFRTIHTPGHTPEHVCFAVTDRGGGATEPIGLVSGDFVFVGDLGRPDLLESAAGVAGAAAPSARALYGSVKRFLEMPEYVQVWPGHGAGSACGKALGAVPQSTVGYEKRFNPSITAAARGEGPFADFILSGQPEPPPYFARMKRLNRDGPKVLGGVPRPRDLTADDARDLDGHTAAVIDTRLWKAFRAGHIPGSLYIPIDAMFPIVAGSYVGEEETIYLVVEPDRLDEAVRDLIHVGLDDMAGWISPEELDRAGAASATAPEVDAAGAAQRLGAGGHAVLDVRREDEFAAGHLPGAVRIAHPRVPMHLAEIPRDRPVLVNCRSGGRSSRAAAYLRRHGVDAINVAGGYLAWEAAGAPVER